MKLKNDFLNVEINFFKKKRYQYIKFKIYNNFPIKN